MVSTVDVAGRFCRKPERRSVAPHARRRVGQGTTQLAEYENHAYTMSDVTQPFPAKVYAIENK